MNMLNSLVLEGTILDEAKVTDTFGVSKGLFTVETKRYYKSYLGDNITETSNYTVYCYGEIANLMQLHANKGQGVRIVGRLKQERWTDTDGKVSSKIVVVAEHIELKPFLNNIA